MGNKRSEIRTNIKQFLEAGFSDSDVTSSIVQNRSLSQQLPSINIITPDESVIPESMDRRRYIRTLTVNIEVRVAASVDTDDELDNLMADVEDVVLSDSTFGGAVLDSYLVNSETDIGFEGSIEIGLGILSYEAKYIA